MGGMPNHNFQPNISKISRSEVKKDVYTRDLMALKLGSKFDSCLLDAILNILSISLTTCMTRMIGAGESPDMGPPGIMPMASIAGGGSLSNGAGAQSTYFELNFCRYSLGNNGCSVFKPPGITPEIAASMK